MFLLYSKNVCLQEKEDISQNGRKDIKRHRCNICKTLFGEMNLPGFRVSSGTMIKYRNAICVEMEAFAVVHRPERFIARNKNIRAFKGL